MFFSKEELKLMDGVEIKNDLEGPDCERCGLYRRAQSPRMQPTGEGKLGALIVAEQPGKEEDDRNEQLVGPAGQLLRSKLEPFGLDLDRDFYKLNALNCHGGGVNRTRLKCCKPMIDMAVRKLNPTHIWLMGGVPVEQKYMGRFKIVAISRWRGLVAPDREWNAWVLPMFHPSYLLRNLTDLNLHTIFDNDLIQAVDFWKSHPDRPEFEDDARKVEIILDFDLVCDLLDTILVYKPTIAYDYETNALKANWPDSRVATMAIAFDDPEAEIYSYAFPLEYRSHWTSLQWRAIKRRLRKIILDAEIHKVAHNLKFEESWTRNRLGVESKGLHWCTMNNSHIIDSRNKYTRLKFQSYIHFGAEDYGRDVDSFIRSRGTSHFNRVMEADLEDLLLYNGLDAYYTYRLYDYQRGWFHDENQQMNKVRQFQHVGLLTMGDIERNGIPIDAEYYVRMDKRIMRKAHMVLKRLYNTEEAKEFANKHNEAINWTSTDHLQMLFKDMGIALPKATKTGWSTDKDSLSKIDHPIARDLTYLRKLEKIQGTYMAQFLRENNNGKIYPFFDCHTTQTYRSSSSMPNFQNIPVRDVEARNYTRGGIIPSRGNQLLEIDYGSMEVRIAACHSQDPVLVRYCSDPSSDMHRDEAIHLFDLTPSLITVPIRNNAKSGFVFPELYGSYYAPCARELWDIMLEGEHKTAHGDLLIEWLYDRGICRALSARNIETGDVFHFQSGYQDFEEHVRACEDNFWKTYKVHRQWQDRVVEEYRQKGYVENKFGFRRGGYLKRNKIINTPIQGDAYLCLQYTMVMVNEMFKEQSWKSKMIGQIHDSIVFDLYPPETELLLRSVKYFATELIREEYEWIIVPLIIEAEIAPVDAPWVMKRQIDSKGYDKDGNLMTHKEINW